MLRKTHRQCLRVVSILALLCLSSCSDQRSVLEDIIESGEFRFVTVESPLTFYETPTGVKEGMEYELANLFAEHLGIELNLIVVDNKQDVVALINRGKAHVGSSALALSGYPDSMLQYGPPYITAKRQLIFNQKNKKPRSIDYLKEDRVYISEEKSIQALAKSLSFYHPDLAWRVLEDKGMAEVLTMVNDNHIPTAIVDSNWVAMYRHLFPEVRVAFDITGELPVGWIYQRNDDQSLHKAIKSFFKKLNKEGTLQKLIKRYYQHSKNFNYVDTSTFLNSIDNRLHKFSDLFKQSAEKTNIDWLLLAAVSYQESHWRPNAKSPTGVRGLMMLTQDTAKALGVEDRLDPAQSIDGGARYLVKMKNKIPERISEEERIWFALAAYNVGYGHLEDARILTQSHGDNPDKWEDVKKYLPLLADEAWYKKLKHGYARGNEPVRYVRNIRRYYDILKWKNSELRQRSEEKEDLNNKESPAIGSPVY